MGKELEKEQLTILENPVMVWTQVGKEFPDNRQNEREIKFIRVGDAVKTAGQLNGEPGSLVHFSTQRRRSRVGVLQVIC